MDKVTVVVPIYNTEKYIKKCIDSIINQTYSNLEIILVDDESPDCCPQICDEYQKIDSRIKVIHKKNEGLGYVRNTGINVCTGEYLTFVDSDDWIDNNHIENLVKEIQESDMVIASAKLCKENGDLIRKRPLEINNITQHELALDMIAPGGKANNELAVAMSVCFNLYKTKIIRDHELNFYSERDTVGEDLFFNLEYILLCKKVNVVNLYGYNYRTFEKSISHRYDPNRITRTEEYYNRLNTMIDNLGLRNEIDYRVERSTISKFRVAINNAMKSNIRLTTKYSIVKNILNNKVLIECLKNFPVHYYRKSLYILAIMMKNKMVLLTMLSFKIRG